MSQFTQDQFRQLLGQKVQVQDSSKQQQDRSNFRSQFQPNLNYKRKANVQLDQKVEKKIQVEEFLPLLSLTENPVTLVKKNDNYRFGNYKKYYKLRFERRWNDPRLIVLNSEYFYQKKVLDIGCNDGTVTLLIAMKYFPNKIQGIDIDYQLINKAIENMTSLEGAYKNMYGASHQNPEQTSFQEEKPPVEPTISTTQQQSRTNEIIQKLQHLPKCFLMNIEEKASENLDRMYVLENIQELVKNDNLLNDKIKQSETIQDQQLKSNNFPKNVYFRVENFISNVTRVNEKYDTILCLSLTKWIHLNWGDEGIKRLFTKVNESLYPRGIFILEAQDWKSYKKKRYYCDDFKKMFKQIKLKPDMFKDMLMAQFGFKLIKEIKPDDVEAISKGRSAFKRIMLIFQK